MASVQFYKCKGASVAKSIMRHADADERLKHEHSNKDIDKSKTELNTSLYDLSYAEMCDRYDEAMQRYQSNSKRAIRKDAVTLLDAIVTVPRDLDDALADQWISDIVDIINKHYKADVVLDAKIHRDEIHDYVDPDTHKTVTSRVHAHIFVLPEVERRLCCKQFTSRQNIMSLNRRIDKMTHNLYGCKFMTGQKAHDRDFQTVEQLKRASDNAELERQSRQISSKLQDTHNKLSVTQKALRDANKQLAAVSQQLQQQKAELHDISISVKKQKRKLNKLREYTNDVRSDLESLLANRDSVDKNELQRIEAEFSDVIEDLRQLVHYHDQFDAEQQLSDEQLEDYFSLMDKYGYAGRSDINCYADDREEYEASYDYSAYDDEDLEL
jgi:archaellum component FlaC